MITANVRPATSELPDARELSPDELNGVSGGWFMAFFGGRVVQAVQGGEGEGGQNDPAQMFAQILQQMTQG
jgi:hypothetical protein